MYQSEKQCKTQPKPEALCLSLLKGFYILRFKHVHRSELVVLHGVNLPHSPHPTQKKNTLQDKSKPK